LNYIESILLAEPALFLDEIQDKLHAVRDIEVSISTHSHTLNRLTITHKAVAKEAMEQNEHLHATWQVVMAQYDACQHVFIDEARVDDHTYSDKWLGSTWSSMCAPDDFSARAEILHSSCT
jgi:hypothetical protein